MKGIQFANLGIRFHRGVTLVARVEKKIILARDHVERGSIRIAFETGLANGPKRLLCHRRASYSLCGEQHEEGEGASSEHQLQF